MQRRHANSGMTLLELMVAASILAIVSLSLVHAFSTTTSASVQSDRSMQVQSSLQSTYETVADVSYDQLLSWNGVVAKHGDHVVSFSTHLVKVGLVQIELTASDARTGDVLARLASFRSGEY